MMKRADMLSKLQDDEQRADPLWNSAHFHETHLTIGWDFASPLVLIPSLADRLEWMGQKNNDRRKERKKKFALTRKRKEIFSPVNRKRDVG